MYLRYLSVFCLFALSGCVGSSIPQTTPQPAPQPANESAENFHFSANLSDGLMLTGHLPDDAAQNSLMTLAVSIFPDTNITNDMRSDGASVSGWHRTTRWGLSSLSKLQNGKLEIIDHSLRLEGEAASSKIKAQVEAATIGLKAEIQSTLQISVRRAK